jgi:UDP-N-acetyl-D-mannosaminuronic acid dehydrogenase
MGVPTALLLAKSGCSVIGFDIDSKKVSSLQKGAVPFSETGIEELYALAQNSFAATDSVSLLKERQPDVFIITVPTPHTENHQCDTAAVQAATRTVASVLKKGSLVILESTVTPGTTSSLVKSLLEETSLRAGVDFDLAYVSEKALPGNTLHEMIVNDRIIGVFNEESADRVVQLYKRFVTGECFVTDCASAETVKLAENTYRDINIAYANELAQLCAAHAVNVWDVIRLANRHPRVNIHAPGPGVGGHCIPIDPWFLAENNSSILIPSSRQINDAQPHHIAAEITRRAPSAKAVTLLGAAYKPDVDDARESPTLALANILKKNGITVCVHDPHVTNFSFAIEQDLHTAIAAAPVVVLLVPHSAYLQDTELRKLLAAKIVIDTKNVLPEPRVLLGRDF